MFIILNYNFYNIIRFKKDITEKVCLVVLHGLADADDFNAIPGPGRSPRQPPAGGGGMLELNRSVVCSLEPTMCCARAHAARQPARAAGVRSSESPLMMADPGAGPAQGLLGPP